MKFFSRRNSPYSVVQSSTQAHRDRARGGMFALFEAVVLRTYFVDERENVSAVATNDTGAIGAGSGLVEGNIGGALSPLYAKQTGYRMECDVYTLTMSHRGGNFQFLRHVPVAQHGGIHDIDLWTPKGSTNFDKDRPFDPAKLDGDLVLLQCVGGVWPKGAVIMGALAHRRNYTDAPRTVGGERDVPKFSGDGQRKDGYVRLSRYNGAICPHVDRFGNLTFSTVEAGHGHKLDLDTGQVFISQNVFPWYTAGNVAPSLDSSLPVPEPPTGVAYPGGLGDGNRQQLEIPSPGGGDIQFKVKDGRRFRIEFQDNQTVVKNFDAANPREFRETGFIQVHKSSGQRIIEIAASDDLVINVRKYGLGNGTLTINAEQSLNGVTIGGVNLDNLATKEFVNELFLKHFHQTGMGPTSLPIVPVAGAPTFTVGPIDDITGIIPTHPDNKIATTKVQGE